MKSTIIQRNKGFYWRIVLLLPIPLALLFYYIYTNGLTQSVSSWWIMSFVLLAFGGLMILLFNSLKKVLDKGHALKIDAQGFDDQASMASPGLIPWERVIKSEIKEYTGTKQLVVHITEPERIINRLSYFKRNMSTQMMQDLGTPIVINTKLIQGKVKELNALINKNAKAKRRK